MTMARLPREKEMYQALLRRDSSYEGIFVAAIRTTGVFCRPTCPARKPQPENVEYYSAARDALAAGFRACKRCHPLEPADRVPTWLRPLVDRLDADPARRWTDADLRTLGLDPTRVRRWFQQNHSMTFHTYQRVRRLGAALGRIRQGEELTRAAFDHGFESLSGFREAFTRTLGIPPGKARNQRQMYVTRLSTPLGPMLAGAVDEGLCLCEFLDRRMLATQIRRLVRHLDCAVTPGDHRILDETAGQLGAYFRGELEAFSIPTVTPGTDFQRACWDWLRTIPYGQTRTYATQARELGLAGGQRAVARANGDNRLALVIPCHRVIRSDGQLAGYGGGIWRKRSLLQFEAEGHGRPPWEGNR